MRSVVLAYINMIQARIVKWWLKRNLSWETASMKLELTFKYNDESCTLIQNSVNTSICRTEFLFILFFVLFFIFILHTTHSFLSLLCYQFPPHLLLWEWSSKAHILNTLFPVSKDLEVWPCWSIPHGRIWGCRSPVSLSFCLLPADQRGKFLETSTAPCPPASPPSWSWAHPLTLPTSLQLRAFFQNLPVSWCQFTAIEQ